jgi:hypothetical protein
VVFGGGEGLLLLIHPDNIDTARSKLDMIFIVYLSMSSTVRRHCGFRPGRCGTGRLRVRLSSRVLRLSSGVLRLSSGARRLSSCVLHEPVRRAPPAARRPKAPPRGANRSYTVPSARQYWIYG